MIHIISTLNISVKKVIFEFAQFCLYMNIKLMFTYVTGQNPWFISYCLFSVLDGSLKKRKQNSIQRVQVSCLLLNHHSESTVSSVQRRASPFLLWNLAELCPGARAGGEPTCREARVEAIVSQMCIIENYLSQDVSSTARAAWTHSNQTKKTNIANYKRR